MFQGKKSIYLGYDQAQFNTIRSKLEASGIEFRVKIQNHSGEWIGAGTVRSHTGTAGTRGQYQRLYEILVPKDAYESALYALKDKKQS